MNDNPKETVTDFHGRVCEMRESEFLAVEDIEDLGDVTVTIDRVRKHTNTTMRDGTVKTVYTLAFVGKQRELIINATRRKSLVEILGKVPAEWPGRKIVLCVEPLPDKKRGKKYGDSTTAIKPARETA